MAFGNLGKGGVSFKWNDEKVKQVMKQRQSVALRKAGAFLEGEIKKSMVKGDYKPYKRGGKIHLSASPGRPPAVDTGRLRASITWQTSDGYGSSVKGWTGGGRSGGQTWVGKAGPGDAVKKPTTANPNELVCVVGTNVEYGKFLELGTPKMGPRPFLRPALENNRKNILDFFNFK